MKVVITAGKAKVFLSFKKVDLKKESRGNDGLQKQLDLFFGVESTKCNVLKKGRSIHKEMKPHKAMALKSRKHKKQWT